MEEIVLRFDRQTASDLLQFIHDAGEHISAGVPLEQLPPDVNERVASVYESLKEQLRG